MSADVTGVRLPAAKLGPPFTSHGHLVSGFSPEGWQSPVVGVARCGGEGICSACSRDAGRIRMLEGVGTPRLGYATGEDLLNELIARIEMGDALPVTKGNLLTAVGDLKEAIGKGAPILLTSRPAS